MSSFQSGIAASVLSLGMLFGGSPLQAQTKAVPETIFLYPIVRPRLASRFGKRRHPIYKATRHHNGLDLAAPRGAPIRAIAGGRVVFADPYAGYGNLVVIEHKSGLTSHYGHCNDIRVNLGDWINPGQIIASVGSTGKVTGPHLHLEIRSSGRPEDPLKLIPGLMAEAEG